MGTNGFSSNDYKRVILKAVKIKCKFEQSDYFIKQK